MKNKHFNFANFTKALFCALLLFNIFAIYTTSTVYADPKDDIKGSIVKAPATAPANTPKAGADPLNPTFKESPAPYQGAEASIRQFLCVPGNGVEDLSNCVNRLYRFGAAIASFAAVFFIALAGYFYIVGGESGKSRAKTMIISVIAGLIIIFTSFIFLKQINPALTEFRSIQPPFLSGVPGAYPKCEDVGLGVGCITSTGEVTINGGCAMPISASAIKSFNNTLHRDQPNTGLGHGPLRYPPNSPVPAGIVDLVVGSGKSNQTAVYTPISGRVNNVGDLGFSGKYISISSDSSPDCVSANSCANMGHIDPTVKVGDTVQAGQQVGMTTVFDGDLGPHLHFELKLGGQWITGDGKGGTWANMKSSIARCSAAGGGAVPSGMVAIKTVVPDIVEDLKYATSQNFIGKALYKNGTCYFTQEMANKLKAAQEDLNSRRTGYKIKAWDCYRSKEVQAEMVRLRPDLVKRGLLADANDNAQHPKGQAIDATIVDDKGNELEMQTGFDGYFDGSVANNAKYNKQDNYFWKSKTDNYSLPSHSTTAAAAKNRELLRSVMEKAGIKRVSSEWWHFDLR